jgi:hypothetical protein
VYGAPCAPGFEHVAFGSDFDGAMMPASTSGGLISDKREVGSSNIPRPLGKHKPRKVLRPAGFCCRTLGERCVAETVATRAS